MPKATLPIPELTDQDKERFWSRVDKKGPNECWLWTGGKFHYGHGAFCIRAIKRPAQRIAFVLSGGKITEEKPCVLHNCPSGDQPACCNPAHLWAGTVAENNTDAKKKGRTSTGDRHASHKYPGKVRRGTSINTAKLTPEDVRTVRKMHAEGRSSYSIARLFGMSKHPILQIVKNKSWRHVL